MEKVYKTKIAIWLVCAIIGLTVIPIIPVLVYDFSWTVLIIVVLILLFALFFLFDIRYTIHDNILSVKCGMLSTTNYDINQIRKIEETNSILAAPAASLDRLAIYFTQQNTPLVISPKDKNGFIRN
jgi:uncharacterized membrane protein YdbT with pleckstrin-like domain